MHFRVKGEIGDDTPKNVYYGEIFLKCAILLPIITLFPQDLPQNLTDEEITDLIEIRSQKLKEIHQKTTKNIAIEQEKQKVEYKKKKGKSSESLSIGMQVLKYNANKHTRKGDRLQPEYTGPYTIEDIKNGKVTLRNTNTNQVLKRKGSIKDLKIYHSVNKW